jgi:hypothetical protein
MNNPISSLVGQYISQRMYTDIRILGRIVGIKGKATLIVEPMFTTKQQTKLNFVQGGFLANCSNQADQKWGFVIGENAEPMTVRVTSNFTRQYVVSEKPCHYYDYNF